MKKELCLLNKVRVFLTFFKKYFNCSEIIYFDEEKSMNPEHQPHKLHIPPEHQNHLGIFLVKLAG